MLITGPIQYLINYCIFIKISPGSLVGTVTAYRMDVRGGRNSSPARVTNFNFSIKSRFSATDPEARDRFPAVPGKKVVGLERGPLSLVSTTEELVDRKVAAPVYKTENTAVGTRHADHVAPSFRKKLAITSPTSGGRSVGIVRSRTQTME
jgi:hypothetical protein